MAIWFVQNPRPVSASAACCSSRFVAGRLGGRERGGQGRFRFFDSAACQLRVSELDQELGPGRLVRGAEHAGTVPARASTVPAREGGRGSQGACR